MPVSKRLRYEVLKRDNHTCRYCGGTAPDAVLTVDHVTPVALGGNNEPSNLVAACKDCNSGKTSTAPDAALVADVKQVDLNYAAAIERVAAARAKEHKKALAYVRKFRKAWDDWTFGGGKYTFDLPSNWQSSIHRFYELGVPIDELILLINVACGNDKIRVDDTFRYFAGCVWKTVSKMQEEAKALIEAEEPAPELTHQDELRMDPRYAFAVGWWAGNANAKKVFVRQDSLLALVDHIEYAKVPGDEHYNGVFYWDGVHPLDKYDQETGASDGA